MAKADKAEGKKAFCNLPGKYYVRRDFKEQLESSDYFKMTWATDTMRPTPACLNYYVI